MSRFKIHVVGAAVLAAASLAAAPGASAASTACPSFRSNVLGSGSTVSQLRARGTSCAAAAKVPQRLLAGLDHRDNYIYCAPPAGYPPASCSVGGYRCVFTGVKGKSADTASCRKGKRRIAWYMTFNETPLAA